MFVNYGLLISFMFIEIFKKRLQTLVIVNSRITNRKEFLSKSLEERISLFKDKFRISDKELEEIRIKSDKEQILELSSLIYSKLREQGFDKNYCLSHITSGILAIVLNDDENLKDAEKNIAKKIDYHFKEEKEYLELRLGISLTAPQVIRMDVFEKQEGREIYLNADISRKVWGDCVKYSYNDFIRGIKIPTEIGRDETIYFGVIFPGASFVSKKNSIRLYGSKREKDFFSKVIIDMVNEMFNVNGKSRKDPDSVVINSQAIYSWFINYINIVEDIRERKIIDFDSIPLYIPLEEAKELFLYGIIARKARIYPSKNTKYFVINLKKNIIFLKAIKELSEQLGYTPYLMEWQGRLIFHSDDLEKIKNSSLLNGFKYNHIGGFINPYHINQLKS